jgi:hypothetical protein
MSERDDTTSGAVPDADDRIGLGRIVEDRRPRTRDARRPDATTGDHEAHDRGVEEASEESFPASDPPTYMSDQATPRDR